MSEERQVTVAVDSLPDIDAALAWVVRTSEREGWLKPDIQIESYQYYDADENVQEGYRVVIRGTTPVPAMKEL